MLSAVPRPVTVRVPAKINLHLAVGGVRPDGFHDLVTVFHAVSLFDEISVEQAQEPALEVHGDGVAEVPLDATNLAWRAVELLAEKAGRVIRTRDLDAANELEADDDAVDDIHQHMFTVLMDRNWTHGVSAAVDVALLARFYERYADHAVAVARRIVYVVTGQMPGPLAV